jgi:hypothetical protein
VDETLVEVALILLGHTPGVLELLVRREELAPADQVETAFERGHAIGA